MDLKKNEEYIAQMVLKAFPFFSMLLLKVSNYKQIGPTFNTRKKYLGRNSH